LALGIANRGYVLNQPDKGKKEFEKALSVPARTTDRERMRIMADSAAEMNHSVEAEGLLRAYLRLYPDDWLVRSHYADFLRSHDRAAEAVEEYKRLLSLSPMRHPHSSI
jgi:predicted Zn-dependent protease